MSFLQHKERPFQLPYWQMNVPQEQRTDQCPYFLLHVSEKDRAILSTKDNEYQRSSWNQVKDYIAQNDLASFRRVPSDLRRYLEFKSNAQSKYGSMLNYVRQERLFWTSLTPSGDPPFSNPSDFVILQNDWPYGIDIEISHLVVWTKFLLDVDPITDDVEPSTRSMIENFVVETFCNTEIGGLGRSNVAWFKNWGCLKSVDGIEHFHVMLYQADKSFVNKIVSGERCKTFKVF